VDIKAIALEVAKGINIATNQRASSLLKVLKITKEYIKKNQLKHQNTISPHTPTPLVPLLPPTIVFSTSD
jgi:hypothetical protein